jgi:4-hydroxybenzoyl-CoA reductase subunit beta
MMRLPPFTYLAPRSIGEAVRMMADHGGDAMLVAGGTDLYPNMKRRQFEPKVLVGLRRLSELAGVRGSARAGLVIGSGTTLADLSSHPDVAANFPALATAAGLVSTPQLRNAGTIGGNVCVDTRCNYYNQSYPWRRAIGFCMKKGGKPEAGREIKSGDVCLVAPGSRRCWAVSSSDTAPVLCSLGAKVRLVGPSGERIIPIERLYKDDGINHLTKAPDEVLTEIILPPADGIRCEYLKLRQRGSFDFPILGVAVALRMNGGTVETARIVLGAVSSAPREAAGAEAMLAGQRLTPELIESVAGKAAEPAKPLDNADLTHPYRKKMARVFVSRALRRLAGLPEHSPNEVMA